MVLARQFLGIQELTNPTPTLRAIFSAATKGTGATHAALGDTLSFTQSPRVQARENCSPKGKMAQFDSQTMLSPSLLYSRC
ncbi:hypothetical protein JMJ77_0014613 [Colletotrichum scovillei]|uniref:Uncharacterized protein n=1 Tax=Colletotrichum scovillei TaxID=1209932 RepID=A0A9P7R5E8_9PEZI|nr:hypothetical protein JMJ77_0014613 [Colletotrichum scovillei]KAG7066152.1 hypothetical protein JMJ78_0012888 [Colletotrichum scovillei]KAG7068751.1 hypothetical protein JMJ76_0008430 [Colletotrichum scovillei]